VGVDLADAQATCPVPLREQLTRPEEAVVAELEPRDGTVSVEVEQEVAGVALAVVDVGQGQAVRISLTDANFTSSVPSGRRYRLSDCIQ
jgi:hypothetical protein